MKVKFIIFLIINVCLNLNIKAQTKIGSVKIKGEIIYLDSIIDKKNRENTINQTITAPFDTIQLRFNGNDRFEPISSRYFYLYQPYKYHSCGTGQYIHVYSFALEPEIEQPSGTCNFSKLDSVVFSAACNPNIQDGVVNIYATNYNILRIQSGMAGLMFSS